MSEEGHGVGVGGERAWARIGERRAFLELSTGSAHLPGLRRRLLPGIVDGADDVAMVGYARIEPSLRKPQCQCAHAVQPARERLQLGIVLLQGRAGTRIIARRPADGRKTSAAGR